MYNKFILDNGIRVVMENIPYVKSVSIGIWIEAGSRKENAKNNGVSHFIEHMLFKGTENRNAKEIAESIENIGGQLNAFTSKECTCVYAKVLDNHLPIAIDVLADMLLNSKFSYEDIEKEKSVVFEEINMYEDSPEDIVYDLLSETIFDGHSLALPVLGKLNTLKNLSRNDILDYYHDNYIGNNIVISVAGNVNISQTLKIIEKYFSNMNSGQKKEKISKPLLSKQKLSSRQKDIEQLNFCIGTEGISQGDEGVYTLLVLNNILGGSMSSRLFQKIREDRGLVYSIYSYPSFYKDTGVFTIYAGLNPKEVLNVTELIIEDLSYLNRHGITNSELIKSKEQLKGNYILGLESTSSRMTAIGKSELLLGEIYSQKEVIDKIDSVTKSNVEDMIERVFNKEKYNISYVGNVKNKKNIDERLKDICFS